VAEFDAFLALAAELADAAGEVIRPYFRQPIRVDDKPDLSPVTVADRAAETAMRRLIASRFPDHGIIGEEFGRERDDAPFLWVLDPIDGTKSFISGVPLFGTLIALTQHGRPILGIIDQPISRERWIGAAGRPTTFDGNPVRCRPCASLSAATVFATSPEMFKGPDAAAFGRDIRVGEAREPPPQLLASIAGEHDVCVRVDEAGHHRAAARIDHGRARRELDFV